mmetsp:Transcript_74676/g.118716  ORF Transcript_74676/g.118716 Transcript_74676/m.118716 type:complete len:158 (-) Transcript_74676:53-526(-)
MMRASAQSRTGEGCGPLPTRMDDWTKLDYYRFCLFQKQVQEEFQRENRQLRSRLQLNAFPSRPNMEETQEPEPTGPVYPFEGNDIIAASLSLQSLEDKAADALSKSAETEKCKAAYEAALRAEEIAFAEAEAAWAAEEELERAAEAAAVKKRRRGGC